jgi:hypothetical protein
VSQFVIPAKSRAAGREPGSRRALECLKRLDSGSRPAVLGCPKMTPFSNCDMVLEAGISSLKDFNYKFLWIAAEMPDFDEIGTFYAFIKITYAD